MIERSYFDEAFLGGECFRVSPPILDIDLLRIEEMRSFEPHFIDAKLDQSDTDGIARLSALGFRVICTQILLVRDLPVNTQLSGRVKFSSTLELGSEVIQAHATQFMFSRFHQDPLIKPFQANALYAAWIQNSLNGVKKIASIGQNFCTYFDDMTVRRIDLLSILDKRRGYANAILSDLAIDATICGLREIQVVTEDNNIPALRAYYKAGFEARDHYSCLHKYAL